MDIINFVSNMGVVDFIPRVLLGSYNRAPEEGDRAPILLRSKLRSMSQGKFMGIGNDFLGFPFWMGSGSRLDGAHSKAPHSQERPYPQPALATPWTTCPLSPAPARMAPPQSHQPRLQLALALSLAPQFFCFIFDLNALPVLFHLWAFAQDVSSPQSTVLLLFQAIPNRPSHPSLQPHSDGIRGIYYSHPSSQRSEKEWQGAWG